MLPVPMLDLKTQYQAIREEIDSAIQDVLASQAFILGADVVALEREIANYSQCKYAIAVSSGTDALLIALMAIGIHPGDEVITSAYSFIATAGSIARMGARPVFVDIDPLSLNINVDKIESVISPRTRAIIPVHLCGQMANMQPLLENASKHGLFVIEDAAQAIGAEYYGQRAGSCGDLGCFSFFPSKNLGGYGDSGMVTTDDADLAERLRLLRNHGHSPKYHSKLLGGNFRMDSIQAAILRVKLKYLDEWIARRQANATYYRQLFQESGLVNFSNELISAPVVLPPDLGYGRHTYHLYILRVQRRPELMDFLKQRQIGCEVYYPIPLHLQECFKTLGYKNGEFPESECAAAETLAIPIHPELNPSMQQTVVQAFKDFYS